MSNFCITFFPLTVLLEDLSDNTRCQLTADMKIYLYEPIFFKFVNISTLYIFSTSFSVWRRINQVHVRQLKNKQTQVHVFCTWLPVHAFLTPESCTLMLEPWRRWKHLRLRASKECCNKIEQVSDDSIWRQERNVHDTQTATSIQTSMNQTTNVWQNQLHESSY